jgi:hypothetical protein
MESYDCIVGNIKVPDNYRRIYAEEKNFGAELTGT